MSIFHKKETPHIAEVAETVAAPEPTVSESAPLPTETPAETTATNCNTTAHLMSYPLVKETVEYVEKLPGVESVEKASKPVADFVHSQSMLKPVIETADKIAVATLDATESVAPCLKTVGFGDIVTTAETPFIAVADTAKKSTQWTADAAKKSTQWTADTYEENVAAPARGFVADFRSFYNKNLYDTKGKPLIRSSFDPLVRPVNTRLEALGSKYLPEFEPLSGEFSSEIEKNVFLSYDLTKRSIPVCVNKKMELAASPYKYAQHAVDVFNKNLAKEDPRSFVSPLNATYHSTIDLSGEAWSTTKKFVGLGQAPTPESSNAEAPGPVAEESVAVAAA